MGEVSFYVFGEGGPIGFFVICVSGGNCWCVVFEDGVFDDNGDMFGGEVYFCVPC